VEFKKNFLLSLRLSLARKSQNNKLFFRNYILFPLQKDINSFYQNTAHREGHFPLILANKSNRGTSPDRSSSRPFLRPSLCSENRPPNPALRANPYPEVTDLFCRLPLPTLPRGLEAARLGDLMRFRVRPFERAMLKISVKKFLAFGSLDFQGSTKASQMPRRLRHSADRLTSSPDKPIPRSFVQVFDHSLYIFYSHSLHLKN